MFTCIHADGYYTQSPHERTYARRMDQPTQRATNYTARSNIDTAQIFLHANGQRPKRAMIRQRSRRRQRRGEPDTEHGLGVLLEFVLPVGQPEIVRFPSLAFRSCASG